MPEQITDRSPQHSEHVDLLVIGWGKGGKTLAGVAGRKGLRVALVEQSDQMVGGSCINIACVPTKVLVHAADERRDSDDLDTYFASAITRRDSLTAAMRKKNFDLLNTVDSVLLVSGRAEFVGERHVAVTAGQDILHLTADTVVINTGSHASLPPIEGAQLGGRIHDSTTIQHLSPLPRSLVVIGGGYVGLEFSSMFAHFGSSVTVLDRGQRPLKSEDADVAATAVQILSDDGVQIVSGAQVTAITDVATHADVTYESADGQHTIRTDAVLLAAGRAASTAGLGLELAGVDVDDRGFIVVDDRLRTSAEGVFAVGDVNGGPQFTYVSLDDNRIVQDQLFGSGHRSTDDRVAVPYTLFLTPPLARVGLTETAAREQGYDVRVATKQVADIAAAPRAKIDGDPRGIVKIVVDGKTDQVLGAALMHVHSEEVINVVALAIRQGTTASQLRDAIYTHPSMTESLNEVLGALNG